MFAATGCNPSEKWSKTDGTDGPGVSVGTLAYSPDGGMYLCVKADGAIAKLAKRATSRIPRLRLTRLRRQARSSRPGRRFVSRKSRWPMKITAGRWCSGRARFHVAANCAANVALYSSGTAGRMDDASSNQHRLPGVFLSAARGGSAGNAPGRITTLFPRGIG